MTGSRRNRCSAGQMHFVLVMVLGIGSTKAFHVDLHRTLSPSYDADSVDWHRFGRPRYRVPLTTRKLTIAAGRRPKAVHDNVEHHSSQYDEKAGLGPNDETRRFGGVNDIIGNDHDGSTEDALLLERFHSLMTTIPIGDFSYEEALLLRDILSSLAERSGPRDPSETLSYAIQAEQVFQRMLKECQSNHNSTIANLLQPTIHDAMHVIQAWEWSTMVKPDDPTDMRRNTQNLPTAVKHVQFLYRQLQNHVMGASPPRSPITEISSPANYGLLSHPELYESVLRIYARSRERGIDRTSRAVYDDAKRQGLEPTLSMYQSLIMTLAKSRDSGAANRAESFLREAALRYPPKSVSVPGTTLTTAASGTDYHAQNAGIDIATCNAVLTAWAKSSVEYGPERAEKLIFWMDEVDRNNGNHGFVRPSMSSFTSLIDAYAQKLDWESVCQAERLFNRLLDQYLNDDRSIEDEGNVADTNLLEPNIATWTIVISAWSKLARKGYKGAPKRADRLMQRMQELHRESRISFGPDAIVCNSVMNAWASLREADGPPRAQEVLQEMYEQYLDGNDSMKPSPRAIGIVLESWMKSNLPDAMDRAESLLDAYEEYLMLLCGTGQEDTIAVPEEVSDIYRTMLYGWCKNGDPERALDYLLDMVDQNMKIDSFCFDRVIEANTQLNLEGSFARSEKVFDLLEECRIKGLVKPNERVYTSYIRALIKARVPNMAEKAYSLLKRMKDLARKGDNQGIQPEVFTYNAVLMACAETSQEVDSNSMNAFKIAIKVFNELRSQPANGGSGPDHVSFGNMLRCSKLLTDEAQRISLINSTFQLCCQQGYVNVFVLRDLQLSAPEDVWRQMLQCPPGMEVDLERFPASWSRNVPSKKTTKQSETSRRFR